MKTCTRCHRDLPLTDYQRHARNKDGLQYICRDCTREIRALRKPPAVHVLPHDDGKRCKRCDTFKPWSDFHASRAARDGHQTYCVSCAAEATKRSQERNAEAFILRGAEKRANARTTGVKTCTKCGETKPVLEFYLHRGTKDGRTTYCAACQRAASRAWTAANAERVRERNAEYVASHPKETRRRGRQGQLRLYGLNEAQYAAMLAEQNGVCAICLQTERYIDARTGEPRKLSVDHDHTTGKNRGLLCGHCNRGIGQFSDEPERLRRAADYLLRASP